MTMTHRPLNCLNGVDAITVDADKLKLPSISILFHSIIWPIKEVLIALPIRLPLRYFVWFWGCGRFAHPQEVYPAPLLSLTCREGVPILLIVLLALVTLAHSFCHSYGDLRDFRELPCNSQVLPVKGIVAANIASPI